MTKTNASLIFDTATIEVARTEAVADVVQLTYDELNLIGGGESSVITD